jgi:hypothetical protein
MVESACNPGLAAKPFQGQRILPDLLRKDQERFLLSRLSYRTEATCEDSPWTLVLCALLTGIILLIDKRPWVRFHAAQSIVVFGGLSVIRIALIFMSSLIGGMLGHGVRACWGRSSR